jgi:hypothetical protein
MSGGSTSSSTSCGASSSRGRPGTSARTRPASTSRIGSGTFSLLPTTATAASTASSSTKVWIVGKIIETG